MPVKITSDGMADWLQQPGVKEKTQKLRYDLKRRGGNRLSLEEVREFIFSKRVKSGRVSNLWRCEYCCNYIQFVDSDFTIDHDLPVGLGGSSTKENFWICCRQCNARKGMLDGESYQRLRAIVETFPMEMQSDIWRRLSQKPQWGVRRNG